MRTTINQLRKELEAIAESHKQINSFFWGDLIEAMQGTTIQYPLMNCYYTGGTIANKTTPITLIVSISDKTTKAQRMGTLNDTESDTVQIIRDVFNILNRSKRWQQIGRVESASVIKFMEKSPDEIAGHMMNVQFTLFDSESICNLPMDGYDFDDPIDDMVCEKFTLAISNLPEDVKNCVLNATCTFDNVNLYYSDGVTLVDTLGTGDSYSIQKHTVSNSDDSYSVDAEFDENTELPDETINVYVNGNFNTSATYIPLSGQSINITA